MTASTRDQTCKDINKFYEFCADQNQDLDEILGGGRYQELKTLLEQFYVYILNSQQLSIRRVGDIMMRAICGYWISAISSRISKSYCRIGGKYLRSPNGQERTLAFDVS